MARIANAPCSWGVIEGIDGALGGYERVIDEMAETGYAGTELGDWGFMPTDPERLRDELGRRGLALVGSWVSVRLHDRTSHETNVADALRTAAQLASVGGPESVVVLGNDPYGDPLRTRNAGRVTPGLSMSDEQWTVFTTGANDVARRVMDETGLRTVFHQHIGTLIETTDDRQLGGRAQRVRRAHLVRGPVVQPDTDP
jgi:inosose dehydratase